VSSVDGSSTRLHVIEALLPAAVRAVEAFADLPDAVLYPEERACVARAVDARRREFMTGRHCARVALGRLGVRPTAIARGVRGAPRWPAGVVGSITHCAGYRAAAVALATDLVAIGIDAEPNEPLPAGVLEVISIPDERARLAAMAAAMSGIAWDRVLFSAKESVYKAWFPLTGAWLDFDGADVAFDPSRGTFVARILASLAGDAPRELAGRFVVRDGLAVTAVAR
jgi:4'-phosphopantetheinyl transferase EntD